MNYYIQKILYIVYEQYNLKYILHRTILQVLLINNNNIINFYSFQS